MLYLHHGDAIFMKRKAIRTLTIRNLPDELADAVRGRAEENQTSFCKALVALLQEHLAESKIKVRKKRDLTWMAGSLSEEDAMEFDRSLKEQRRIDPEMWK